MVYIIIKYLGSELKFSQIFFNCREKLPIHTDSLYSSRTDLKFSVEKLLLKYLIVYFYVYVIYIYLYILES